MNCNNNLIEYKEKVNVQDIYLQYLKKVDDLRADYIRALGNKLMDLGFNFDVKALNMKVYSDKALAFFNHEEWFYGTIPVFTHFVDWEGNIVFQSKQKIEDLLTILKNKS